MKIVDWIRWTGNNEKYVREMVERYGWRADFMLSNPTFFISCDSSNWRLKKEHPEAYEAKKYWFVVMIDNDGDFFPRIIHADKLSEFLCSNDDAEMSEEDK